MKRDDVIDILHRYRRGEIKSADVAADEIIATMAQICGACGQPWNGEGCGQKDNGHPFPTCYPVTPT